MEQHKMTNKKLIHRKWKRYGGPGSYSIKVPRGYLVAGWGNYKRPEPNKVENSRNYYLALYSTENKTRGEHKIADATYDTENMDLKIEISPSFREKHGIRELLKYSPLINLAEGIPIERKVGLNSLIKDLEKEIGWG
jgi:hypothetical protein